MNCKVSLVGTGLDRVEGLALSRLSIKALMESANFDFNANQEIPVLGCFWQYDFLFGGLSEYASP